MAESSRPKKRGRPAREENAESGEDQSTRETRPLKRTKPSAAEGGTSGQSGSTKSTKRKAAQKAAQAVSGDDDTADSLVRRSRRDRRSADENPWWASKSNETSPPAQQTDPKTQSVKQAEKKKQTSSKDKPDKVAMKPPPQKVAAAGTASGPGSGQGSKPTRPPKAPKEPAVAEESGARRSGRDRRSADDNPWWNAQASNSSPKETEGEKAPSGPSKRSNRGRPSLGEVSVSEVQNKVGREKKAPGRKSLDPKSDASSSKRPTTRAVKRLAGREIPRSSGGAASDTDASRQRRRVSAGSSAPAARRRRSDPADDSAAEPTASSAPKYRHLTSRMRQIPRTTIAAKWTALDDASIAAVDSIVTDASRPVLMRMRDHGPRHQLAQTILRTFAKRLHSKLVKRMPFPPSATASSNPRSASGGANSHELELDFERTVDAVQALEKTLDPLLHSVALLDAEREREEAALEREYKLLKTLETNAKAEAREWRERARRDHVLAPERRAVEGEAGEGSALETVKAGGFVSGGVFKDLKEESLVALSQQIGSHMESMKGNLQQIDGVLPAIVKSRAALQGVLHQYLTPAQYEQAVLG